MKKKDLDKVISIIDKRINFFKENCKKHQELEAVLREVQMQILIECSE